ncbi:unnamed protein product [Leptosia nina]|uniref:Uncharacterized protein n=1 Tax=Leptosia nina TaxID=320188 RepID=A0AAV1J1K3_9NEOP
MFCEVPDFGRCCLCLPLRKGILVFGYLNVLFSAFMTGVYSYSIHNSYNSTILVYHGSMSTVEDKACLIFYLFDFVFALVLVYGGHTKIIKYLKAFYYYAVTTLLATLVLQIVGLCSSRYPFGMILETSGLFLFGLSLHLYLILLVRSLLNKLERSGHTYENQLHQIVNGEIKVETNGVYPSIVVPNEREP